MVKRIYKKKIKTKMTIFFIGGGGIQTRMSGVTNVKLYQLS